MYDHAWTQERIRLAGLETALDPGTFEHLTRLGVDRGWRCLDVGAGGGTVASWLAQRAGPDGEVIATDLETDFLETVASNGAAFKVLRHNLMSQALPAGFHLVHARYLVEWLPDKRLGLERMAAALCSGGVLLVEEPDFVTMFHASEPPSLRKAIFAAMRYLEASCAVDTQYGRRVLNDISAVGLDDTGAEGRCPVVRGGSPPAAHFLALTLQKLRGPLLARKHISDTEFEEALAALQNPAITVYMPMTVAAWGRRR